MDSQIFKKKDAGEKRGRTPAGPEGAGGMILTLFLCVLIPAVSFYAPTGYQDLGEMKFRCFRALSFIFVLLLLPAAAGGIRQAVQERRREGEALCTADVAAAVCVLFLLVSWLLAANRAESLWGTVGWRMGLFTQLMAFFLYFCGRLLRVRTRFVLTAAEVTGLIVFLLAVLNRLQIYPLPFMGVSPDFLSTIGNADWYAGYLAVFLPVFAADLTGSLIRSGDALPEAREKEDGKESVRRLFVLLGLLAGLASVATQGTASGWLALCAAAAVLTAAGLLIAARGEGGAGSIDSRAQAGTSSEGARAGASAGRTEAVASNGKSTICRLMACLILTALAAAFILCLAIVWIHANADREPARSLIASLYFRHGIDFRAEWGNGRGVIWRLSGELFRGLPPVRKLFGVGPDGFPAWIGTRPQLLESIGSYFGAVRVTNAHCELFTALIDEGALFALSLTAFYAALFFDFMRTLKSGSRRTDAAALCGAMMTASAAAQQMFTFRTVVTAPFFLAFAGIMMHIIHDRTQEGVGQTGS